MGTPLLLSRLGSVRFHVMHGAEGRNDPFSVLLTRLQRAPRYVIYDFACNLEEYAMNREPAFFAETTFLIDGFHCKNHTRFALALVNDVFSHCWSRSCSKAHFIKNYPALHGVNSSCCEQYHSYISRLRRSATHMKQSTFMQFLRAFVNLWNLKIVAKMNL
jgi:hypothetical protein